LMADNPEAASFREVLTNNTGLLCIIDPERSDGNHYFPLLFKNFSQLSTLMNGDGGGRIDIPVAVCVAKADQHPDAFDNPREFVRKLMGRIAFSVLLTYCTEMEFFAASAVGVGNVERDPKGDYVPKGLPQPKNVLAPFEWLFDRQ
jgi:hypothetical protein